MSDFELLGGLPGIFRRIFEQEQTGALQIQREDSEVYIYFKNGCIRMVASAHKRSILAEALRRNKMEQEQLDLIYAKQRETKKSLLATIKEVKLFDDAEKQERFVNDICKNQVEEEVYDILMWPDITHCEFAANEVNNDIFDEELLALPINLNPEAVAVEAARRQDEWLLIREVIPSQKDIPCLTIQEDEEDDSLNEDSQHVLSFINGILDIDEILDKAHISHFNAMKILCELLKNNKARLRDANELKQMAGLDILKENTFKCIRLYERLEELGLKNLDTISWLARAHEKCGLTNKAVSKYRELGVTSLESNLYKEAVDAYKKVVQLTPEDLEAYEKLIHALYKCSELEKAAEVSAVYARKISVVDKRKAIMVLDEANKSFPSSPSNLELMATLYIEMGDKDNAISTYNILALLMNKQKKPELALDAYRKILNIDPKNIKAHIELADGLIELGKSEEAVVQYKELGALLFECVQEESKEYLEILIAVCKCITQYEPNSTVALKWLVDAHLMRDEKEEALSNLQKLLTFLQKEQNLEETVIYLRKLATLDAKDFKSRKMLADTLLRMGKKRQAIKEYTQLGLDTFQIGDMRSAREAFEAILVVSPFDLTARQKHADILRQLNRQAKAVEEYKLVGHLTKSVEKFRDARDAFSHVVELAPETELSGFVEVAKLCEMLDENPQAVEYYRRYAMKNFEHGNYGEVVHICQLILALDPSDNKAIKLKERAEIKIAKFHQAHPQFS